MSKTKKIPDFTSPAYWNDTIKMSLSKFFMLCVLCQKPMHGYEVGKEVKIRTSGSCSPAEGTIYPVLRQFEAGGYVTCASEVVSGRERKVYSITDKGRKAFQVALKEWSNMTRCLEQCEVMADDDCCDTSTC